MGPAGQGLAYICAPAVVGHVAVLAPLGGVLARAQRGCARALYYLAPEVPVVGGIGEAREGGKLPSLC